MSILSFQVVLDAVVGRLHRLGAGLPVGGTDLAMLVGELESLDQTERLVDVAADRQVVDRDLPQDALGVDDEQAPKRHPLVLLEHAVGLADGVRRVGQKRDIDVAQAALGSRGLHPGPVAVERVRGAADDGALDLGELLDAVAEGNDLRRADEGEVLRVEEEDHILALVLLEADLQLGDVAVLEDGRFSLQVIVK